jgi:hypothetical protein
LLPNINLSELVGPDEPPLTLSNFLCVSFSHEHRFLIAGLDVEKKSSWEERQAAYLAAAKAFLTKLKPDFANLPVTLVKAIRYDPKLLLSVDCAKPKQ